MSSDAGALIEYLLNEETTVIAVDADLNVRCQMSNAASLLKEGAGLSIRDGRLAHQDADALQALCSRLAKALGPGRPCAVVLPGTWGHAWHVVITPEANISFSSPPRAVLRIERRHIFRRPEVGTLQSVLRLSQAEARVLSELICGHSVIECASILDLSVTTVRKHLAAILRKTCCSRQSELMRLVSIVM
jgi:DNA-binding CsgD family transcriptional regulator